MSPACEEGHKAEPINNTTSFPRTQVAFVIMIYFTKLMILAISGRMLLQTLRSAAIDAGGAVTALPEMFGEGAHLVPYCRYLGLGATKCYV